MLPLRRLSLRRFLLGSVILVVVFVAGAVFGVVLERRFRPSSPLPAPLAEQLLGRWAGPEGEGPLDFRPDGTFDVVKERALLLPPSREFAGAKLPRMQETISGLYHWIDGEHIELALPQSEGGDRVQFRVVIQDDELTLISMEGEVVRGKRQR